MLKRYLFILGRDSELSKLELFALLNRLNIKFSINQNSKEFVVFDIDNFNSQQFINYSGGIVKIAEKIDLKNYFYEGTEKNITKLVEQAYFEGQRDAINGDVRIKLNSEGVYFWTKSCWNSGITPIFNPTYLDSKNENSK